MFSRREKSFPFHLFQNCIKKSKFQQQQQKNEFGQFYGFGSVYLMDRPLIDLYRLKPTFYFDTYVPKTLAIVLIFLGIDLSPNHDNLGHGQRSLTLQKQNTYWTIFYMESNMRLKSMQFHIMSSQENPCLPFKSLILNLLTICNPFQVWIMSLGQGVKCLNWC